MWKLKYVYFSVDCGDPAAPANGTVMTPGGTTFEHLAIYDCIPGYELSFSIIRTCLSTGMWSGAEPTCDPVGKYHNAWAASWKRFLIAYAKSIGSGESAHLRRLARTCAVRLSCRPKENTSQSNRHVSCWRTRHARWKIDSTESPTTKTHLFKYIQNFTFSLQMARFCFTLNIWTPYFGAP